MCDTSGSVSTETGSDLKDNGFILPELPSLAVQSQSKIDITSMKRKDDGEYENNKRLKKGEDKSLQKTDDLLDCANRTHDSGFPNEGIPHVTSQSELYSHHVKSGCMKMSQNLKINETAGNICEGDDVKRNAEIVDNIHENEDCDPSSLPHALQDRDDRNKRNTNSCLLNAVVSVNNVSPDIIIEMVWLEGTDGRDAMHQVMQYIKNNVKFE